MSDMQAMTIFSSQDFDTAMQNTNKRKLMQQSVEYPHFQGAETQKRKIKCTYKHKED